ncbi:hypothetical protein J2Z83_001119 [Virgibacillus natechei]|uniref:YppF-like protein n=1 Tax=Virgibacillus natechei TaxID=1216297 RepID=A0ABS4IDK7_9BACI|nr:YppF family protein [Virgibacillus natechei]MBP1969016.1 hypothetical protein [Virgibacillus natechei]UZD14292.1 YppF family protein [Virgibacillus natechei]
MLMNEIMDAYEQEKKRSPKTTNDLLDFYQNKYITGDININYYQRIYHCLREKGAISAHEYA